MRGWLVFLIILASVAGIGAFVVWHIPRLLEVSPGPGEQRVSQEASLQLVFSRRMQNTSVVSHITLEPRIDGAFTWEENTLLFTPESAWPSGITVTVRLDAGAFASGFPPLPTFKGKTWSFSVTRPLLAYLWPANLPADIYALDPPTGEILRLTEGANVQDFSVNSDGSILYYSAITAEGRADLYQLDWRKSIAKDQAIPSLIQVCPAANCHTVRISPDGAYLAYESVPVQSPGTPSFPQVYLFSLANGVASLAGDPNHETMLPDWSPTGKLAFYDRTAQAFILLDVSTQERHSFSNQTGEAGGWTADGTAYVTPEISFVPIPNAVNEFSVSELPTSHLMHYDWTTGQVTDLTGAADLEDAFPVFSPDGKHLTFARRSFDPKLWTIGRQLWLSDPDGENARPLQEADVDTLDSFNHYNFAWKPDSSQLAYVRSNQDYPLDPPELWLVDSDGLNRVRLVIGGYAPLWIY